MGNLISILFSQCATTSVSHSSCDLTGSTESVASLTSIATSSSYLSARRPISVVHTGVKSAGCEKRICARARARRDYAMSEDRVSAMRAHDACARAAPDRTAHLSFFHSWKDSIGPCVVSALKSGTMLPRRSCESATGFSG